MAYPEPQLRLTWVATPPGGLPATPGRHGQSTGQSTGPSAYHGPPAYPTVPRWGFPLLSWREPTAVPGTQVRQPRSQARVVRQARRLVTVLWLVAISAFLAAGGEVWRYVLLLLGRTQALPGQVVAVSDALVVTAALLAAITGVVALVMAVLWLMGVRELSSRQAGVAPARPDWQVLVGVLVPVVNLFLAGSILAEVEHTAVGAPAGRPRPSRLVLGWWLAWVVSEVLAITTVLLGLRSGVQAMADGVLWYAATDLVAIVVAVLTIRVVAALTGLVAPAATREPLRMRVIRVEGAPAPPLRPGRRAGAAR